MHVAHMLRADRRSISTARLSREPRVQSAIVPARSWSPIRSFNRLRNRIVAAAADHATQRTPKPYATLKRISHDEHLTLHSRYDRDERRLVEAASTELWTDQLLDAVIDVASPILRDSSWDGLPEGSPPRTAERYTASSALTAMAIRAARSIALVVRAGYGPEAVGGLRRLFEIAGHSSRVAEDVSGEYAENWLLARGRAAKPRIAFGDSESDPLWRFTSSHAHANFDGFARQSTALEGSRLIHSIGPQRDAAWDNIALWFTARYLLRVLAAVVTVHPHVDDTDLLVVGTRVVEAESQLEREIDNETRRQPDF